MNPWAILGVVVLWIASLAAVGSWQNDAGHVAERDGWIKRENTELREANAKIKQLEDEARLQEHRWAQNQADIAALLEKERQDAKRKTDRLIADYRAGTLRLRDPSAARQQAGGSQGSATAAAPGQCDGTAPGGLSGEAAEFLFNLTGEANEVTDQLTACQAVIVSDRTEK